MADSAILYSLTLVAALTGVPRLNLQNILRQYEEKDFAPAYE